MADFPHPYGAYLRLQQQSSKNTCIDDQYWGMDAALDALLTPAAIAAPATVDSDLVSRSAARKERYRAQLRAAHLSDEEQPGDADETHQAVQSREIVRMIIQQLANDDWVLLRAVAEGKHYEELANDRGVSAGSLRVRVSRIRCAIVSIAA